MKKIALGLATIAAVISMTVAATGAYFSDSKAVSGNTFTTGTVALGDMSYVPMNISNLVPGVPQSRNVAFEYTGTTNADVWLGVRGTTPPTALNYFGDKMDVTIADFNTSYVYYNGLVSGLSTSWHWIASDIGAGYHWYTVTFTLHSEVTSLNAGQTNTDTEFLFYAVQTGAPAPVSIPWMTTGTNF